MKKITTYFTAALILSYVVNWFLLEGIRRNESGIYSKFNTVFQKKNNYDVIFLGSSRAEVHFDPRIYDSVCGTNAYNIGMEGASIDFAYSILKAYLQNSAIPKKVIYSVDHVFNFDKADTVFMYPRYIPYLDNAELYKSIRQTDKRFTAFRWVPFYSMAHMGSKYVQSSLYGWFGSVNSVEGYSAGFYSFENKVLKPEIPAVKKVIPDPVLVSYVDSLALYCKTKGITLELVISPVHPAFYEASTGVMDNISALRAQADKYGIKLFDYSKSVEFESSDWFYDGFHLNGKGAANFTRIFSADEAIKQTENR